MRKKQKSNWRRFVHAFPIVLAISGIVALVGWHESTQATCTETLLADVPLELKSKAAPGIITLVLDNTRNMYYTIMTSVGDGTYYVGSNQYEILFPEHTFAGAKVLPYEYRNHWKTQWSGFNTMYYNPEVTYVPWPRWNELGAAGSPANINADPNTPRMHPLDTETINLDNTFYLLQSGGTPGANIQVLSTDTSSLNPSRYFEKVGTWDMMTKSSTTWDSESDLSYYTSDSSLTATWTVRDLGRQEAFDVYVHIPYRPYADATQDQRTANYTVTGKDTITVNRYQRDYPGWTLLAPNFKATNSDPGSITVTVQIANSSETGVIDVDAIRLLPVGSVPPDSGSTLPAGDVNIVYAHYFVKNASGETYLVNMNGSLEYYKFNDNITVNDQVDYGELSSISASDAQTAEIATDRTYVDERQNFANWYQFYRKRAYTGIGAVSQFVDGLSGVFFRLYGFPPASFKFNLEPININMTFASGSSDKTDSVLTNLYNLRSPSALSNEALFTALNDTGDLMETGKSNGTGKYSDMAPYSSADTYPYFTKEYGGECQQAFAILMTGGYWVVKNNTTYPDHDGDGFKGTVADAAFHYYDRDLKNDLLLGDLVPPYPPLDNAIWQHLVVYGLSFGAKGTLKPEQYPDCNIGGACPTWPEPKTEDPTTIDDLWHATANAGGLFVSASNPEELVSALKAIRSDIERRMGAAAAVSTNSVQRQTGTHLYQGTYHSSNWYGDLQAKPISPSDGSVQESIWSAQTLLDDDNVTDWKQRNIVTFNGTIGVNFNTNLGAAQKNILDPDPLQADKIIDYLRGDRSLEIRTGGAFRNRTSRLGDIVHSEPVYHEKVVYVGSNDGMLHAFDAENGGFSDEPSNLDPQKYKDGKYRGGRELFAYIPRLVFDHLAKLASPTYDHLYYVNNTPYAKNVGGMVPTSYLVGGLSKGGKGIYCLDITNTDVSNPYNRSKFQPLWEYSAVELGDPDLGYTFSRPFIVNTKAAGWVVVFGNGYNSANGHAVLYVLDVKDGSLVRKIDTFAGDCNGIVANVAIIDPNYDGYADYVYVGDLKGNMWKFDISNGDFNNWGVAFESGGTAKPLFSAKNASGAVQPITAAADVMRHCNTGNPGYIVVFGTGRYVNEADFATIDTQTIYGIWDTQPAWEYLGQNPKDKYLGELTGSARFLSNTSAWNGFTLLAQSATDMLYNGKIYSIMSDNEIDYWNLSTGGTHLGWYFDLPTRGQRVIRDPLIRDGVVVSIASTPVQKPCSSGGTSVLYQIDACSGGAPPKPHFDLDNDGKVESDDVIMTADGPIFPSGVFVNAMIYKPIDIKDRLYTTRDSPTPDAVPDILEIVVPPVVGGMLYWRETDIRRPNGS